MRPSANQPKFPPEIEAEIGQRYEAGKSATQLAAEYGASITAIGKILKRNGVKQRSASEIHRRYRCNHNFFATIDNEEKAYWLGFIAADGYVRPSQTGSPELLVRLQARDAPHLERLRSAIDSEHPVTTYMLEGHQYGRFAVRSPQLAADLAKHGVVPGKTWTLGWPDYLDDELRSHYLRGFFDGDGSFCLPLQYKNGKRTSTGIRGLTFRLTSNQQFLEGCQRYLVVQCDLAYTKLSHRQDQWKGTVPTLVYNGRNQVSRIFHLMYDDATIWLPRKREKAEPYIS